ncbi:MAG: endonuclease/exonuclease/phosphatase family protein [Gammaproteobacteria bacterium]|nr:endonuclease/exonuclease/phosphatase family protein [Gammaproteobacteria bacterium]
MTQTSPGHRSDRLKEGRLRVITWNVWWRFGPRWQERQPLILDVLRHIDADIVTLQEVWGDASEDQAAVFASALGYASVYAPASYIDGLGFGNAVLSRWPIEDHEVVSLPAVPSADGSRNCNVVYARIEGPNGPVGVCSTHLSYKPEESAVRQNQVEALCRFVSGWRDQGEFPPLIGGDFNATPVSDEIRMMTGKRAPPVEGLVFYDAWEAAGEESAGFTWHNANPNAVTALEPNRRLDYLFVGRPSASGSGHVLSARLAGQTPVDGLCPSDHYALVAELRY